MATAKINLTVTNFRDISTTNDTSRWTTIANPVVTDDANGKVSIDATDPMTIRVSGRAAINLEFTILPAGAFVPTGIAFKQTLGSGDGQGKQNFDLGAITASTITINDKFNNPGASGTKTKWEFYIMVQRVSDSALGIIDPDIENEN